MTQGNENRPGYKLTKVGWIPSSWQVKSIASQIELISGQHLFPGEYEENTNGVPYVTGPTDWKDGKIQTTKSTTHPKVLAEKGDILITCKGSGTGSLFLADRQLCISRQLMAIRPNGINWSFLFAHLHRRSEYFNHQAIGLIPGISRRDILDIMIPLPSDQEQQAIAECLDTWDQVIDQAKALIDAKKRLKKGLMQQLLTGRLRFPKFGPPATDPDEIPDGWQRWKLSEVTEISFSGVDKKTHPEEYPVRLCNYMDVYRNEYIHSSLDFMEATATDSEIAGYSLQRGDVLLTKDSETADDIAVTAVVEADLNDVLCGYHLAFLRPNRQFADPVFLSNAIGSGATNRHLARYANGVTRYGLTTSSVRNAPVLLPFVEEQHEIASVVHLVDDEIQLLEASLVQLLEQKRGLMQKLLTGEVRVPINLGDEIGQ